MAQFGLPSKSVVVTPAKLAAGAFNVGPLCAIERQDRTNWCWAAVAYSVARYVNAKRHKPFKFTSQQDLACNVLFDGQPGKIAACNANPDPSANNLLLPAIPIGVADLQVEQTAFKTHPLSPDTLKNELAAGRPMGLTIAWDGGLGGHAIAVVGGVEIGGDLLFWVGDPKLDKPQQHSFETLTRYYPAPDSTGAGAGTVTGEVRLVFRILP
ncbi:MAG: papain-like cysteine protease family protein [Enhydrobacter sp.]